MATHAEVTLVQHLCIPESLRQIVDLDLPDDLMPTDELSAIFHFSVDYWHVAGVDGVAPSEGVLRTHFDNTLNEHEVDLAIEPDGLEWALAVLKGMYINRQWQPWVRTFAGKIGSPDNDELTREGYLTEAIEELMGIEARFSSKAEHTNVVRDAYKLLDAYHIRAANPVSSVQGIRFGMDLIDQHTGGIRPGEIGVLAGVPKAGKSFFGLNAADACFEDDGMAVLFSLENAVQMTMERLACAKAMVDAHRWEQGLCNEEEIYRVRMWLASLQEREGRTFHILQPEPGKRTFAHMIRKARTLGDVIIVDQLPWVEIVPGTERKARHEQIRDMLHDAANLLNSGKSMPMLLITQINREGQKAAEKTGHLEMYHLAEAAEIERTASHVWGLWQSKGMRDAGNAWLQGLAARRYGIQHFDMSWVPHRGIIAARGSIQLPDAA